MTLSPLHVIVLDDRSRFALHTWRYLSRSVGFGIGDISSDGAKYSHPPGVEEPERDGSSAKISRPWRLETPAGDAVVWWVYIQNSETSDEPEPWIKELDHVLGKATDIERRVFLVDVRGESGAADELWSRALSILSERGVRLDPKNIWLVSSYGMGSRRPPGDSSLVFNIRPKSSETLQEVAERIWPIPADPAETSGWAEIEVATDPKTFHFLVSGAGFELKSQMAPPISPIGVPSTWNLLEQAYNSDDIWRARGRGNTNDNALPYIRLPLPPFIKAIPRYRHRVLEAARDGLLDQLWDGLLESVLEEVQIETRDAQNVQQKKAAMLAGEESARESFRSAFLGDDWGQLTQALDAAALPWNVWLTTNYTHFVDRAITLLNGRTDKPQKDQPKVGGRPASSWQILSIASEAEHLRRRIFFDERQSQGTRSVERVVFKLHGDLAHLSTMAVAGEDKELFGLMTQMVDSLHWLYEAALKWMEQLLKQEGKKGDQVYWHIVGHGLKDQVLLSTLKKVIDSTGATMSHSFFFIQPKTEDGPRSMELAKEIIGGVWTPQLYRADQWMAMLRKFFLAKGRMWTPPKDGDLCEAVRGFIRSVDGTLDQAAPDPE